MRTASSPPARFRPLATRDRDEPVRDERTRLRAGELHAADTRGLSSAHGRRSPRPRGRDPRGPAHHVPRLLRAGTAAGVGAHRAWHRRRRHRVRHAPQRPGDARRPLRRAHGRSDPQHHQHPARCAHDRLHPRPRRGEGAHHRPRVRRRRRLGAIEYEAFLAEGSPDFEWRPPRDESQAIALNYTSGTTGNPKGVVYHHRGAYLNALGNAITFGLDRHSVYLWTLPMFHCNGWTYTWD